MHERGWYEKPRPVSPIDKSLAEATCTAGSVYDFKEMTGPLNHDTAKERARFGIIRETSSCLHRALVLLKHLEVLG